MKSEIEKLSPPFVNLILDIKLSLSHLQIC